MASSCPALPASSSFSLLTIFQFQNLLYPNRCFFKNFLVDHREVSFLCNFLFLALFHTQTSDIDRNSITHFCLCFLDALFSCFFFILVSKVTVWGCCCCCFLYSALSLSSRTSHFLCSTHESQNKMV